MGHVSDIEVNDGEAVKVATGGMVPGGADAVQMVEYTEWVDSQTIHASKTVSPLENVIQVGEDVKQGDVVLHRGHWVRPQDIRPHGRHRGQGGLGLSSSPGWNHLFRG